MKLRRLYVKGLTVINEPVDLDFDQMSEGLIAIVGQNGSGKTSLLEAAFAALFRYLPSREGSLYKWCTGKDAQIILGFDQDGHTYEARLLIDAVAEKAEAYLTEDGKPLVNGKVTQFDKEIARIVGRPEVLLSSVFSAQKKTGSFSRIPVAERKGLFTELLGLGHYPKLEELAKSELANQQGELRALQANRETTERQVTTLQDLTDQLDDVTRRHEETKVCLDARFQVERDLRDQLLEVAGALGKFTELERQHAELEAEKVQATTQLSGVLNRIRTRKTQIQAELQEAKDQLGRRRNALIAENEKLTASTTELAERRRNNQKLLDDKERIDQAVAQDEVYRAQQATLSAELMATLQAERAAGAIDLLRSAVTRDGLLLEQQIKAQALLVEELEGIPCHGIEQYSTCPKILSSVAARGALPVLRSELGANSRRVLELESEAQRARQGYRTAGDIQADLRKLTVDAEANAKVSKLKAAVDLAEQRITELDGLIRDANSRAQEIAAELSALTAPAVPAEDAMLLELAGQESTAASRLSTIDDSMEQVAKVLAQRQTLTEQQVSLNRELEKLVDDLREVRSTLSRLAAQIETLEQQQKELAEVRARLEEIESQILQVQAEIGDWTLLVRALGKDGIPALEIDAAGPAISGIVNDLLSHCFSSRFAIDLQTQKSSADGKRMLEDFDIRVLDNRRGAWGSITGLSGGEEVVVNEALGFGISIYNKSARRFQTAFRDETTGALDPAAAVAYVEMLRRARAVGGFSQVLFITHNSECSELADARLCCDAGKVTAA